MRAYAVYLFKTAAGIIGEGPAAEYCWGGYLQSGFVQRHFIDGSLDFVAHSVVGFFKHFVRAYQLEPHHQAAVLDAITEACWNAERIAAKKRFHANEELLRNAQLPSFACTAVDLFVIGQLHLAIVETSALAEANIFLGFEGATDFQHVSCTGGVLFVGRLSYVPHVLFDEFGKGRLVHSLAVVFLPAPPLNSGRATIGRNVFAPCRAFWLVVIDNR